MAIEFPTTIEALLTVGGIALFASLIGEWVKNSLPDLDKRWMNLIVLALSFVVAAVATLIRLGWKPASEPLFAAFLLAFFGASLATYGYEVIKNLLGLMGYGSRS